MVDLRRGGAVRRHENDDVANWTGEDAEPGHAVANADPGALG